MQEKSPYGVIHNETISLALDSAQHYQFAFVVNFVLRDYDAVWEMIGALEDISIAWRDTGPYDEAGEARPALEIWRRWLAPPCRSEGKLSGAAAN